jgi:hypothetical protein
VRSGLDVRDACSCHVDLDLADSAGPAMRRALRGWIRCVRGRAERHTPCYFVATLLATRCEWLPARKATASSKPCKGAKTNCLGRKLSKTPVQLRETKMASSLTGRSSVPHLGHRRTKLVGVELGEYELVCLALEVKTATAHPPGRSCAGKPYPER